MVCSLNSPPALTDHCCRAHPYGWGRIASTLHQPTSVCPRSGEGGAATTSLAAPTSTSTFPGSPPACFVTVVDKSTAPRAPLPGHTFPAITLRPATAHFNPGTLLCYPLNLHNGGAREDVRRRRKGRDLGERECQQNGQVSSTLTSCLRPSNRAEMAMRPSTSTPRSRPVCGSRST